jgi:acetoin utilization deacetylase AcuC-like enzyme
MRAMLVGYSYDPIYARHDMGAGHPECPERVQVIDAHLRSVGLFERLVSFKAEPASRDDVLRAHEANYVERVFALAPGPPEFDSLKAKWLIFMGLTSKRSITDWCSCRLRWVF